MLWHNIFHAKGERYRWSKYIQFYNDINIFFPANIYMRNEAMQYFFENYFEWCLVMHAITSISWTVRSSHMGAIFPAAKPINN